MVKEKRGIKIFLVYVIGSEELFLRVKRIVEI